MRQHRSADIDPGALAHAVGAKPYAVAADLVRRHAVVRALWNSESLVLFGTVHGRFGEMYSPVVRFSAEGGVGLPMFVYGECDCREGMDCEHVAALVLVAAGTAQPSPAADDKPDADTWEQSLGSLLASGSSESAGDRGRTPLALELTLTQAPAPPPRARARGADRTPCVHARLVQPGKRGGWVGGSLNWGRLATVHHYGDYDEAQIRLLQEMHAASRSRNTAAHYYYYGRGDEKTIDLSALSGRQLWSLLEEADEIGLRLVHSRAKHGAVHHQASAQVCMDVTTPEDGGPLLVAAKARLEGSDADVLPIGFLGTEGHGLIYADRAQAGDDTDVTDLPFGLARLGRAAPRQLRQQVLQGTQLAIPAEEEARFRDEYYPRLRHLAAVTSSDGSFTPPEISEPTLVLCAGYEPDHELDLAWEWSYQVGDSEYRVPAGADRAVALDEGYRDPAAERAVLAGLDHPLDEFGLGTPDSDPAQPTAALEPSTRLGGADTMRFTTELLPLLSDTPGVAVEVTGDPADYREVSDSLRIAVSTDDIAGETDWFDLGVSVSVEGTEVPFAAVFTALANDEPYLLLDDGAYFSLDKPTLQSLKELIQEAQALQDSPADQLRISRFQVGLWDELAALGVVERQAGAWQRQVQGLLSLSSVDTPEPPETLAPQLRPYQLDGFGWLAFLWQHQLGGVLADDMGLGKTLQSLALISHAKQADPDCPPFLIVAPASVVPNWAAESARFTPELATATVTETLRRSRSRIDEVVSGADVVIVSYTLFRLEFDDYAATSWSGLVMDEAQVAKNYQSKIYQCLRRLAAPFKLAITGTPMENNLMELWSVLSITSPGLFPTPERFREYYARPIEKGGDARLLAQLRRRVKPLLKRRTKEQVAGDLPAKQEQVLDVELHPQHRKLYQRYLQRERQKVLGLLDDVQRNRFTILRSLTLLRQLSLHAGLIDGAHEDLASAKIDALFEQLQDVAAGGHRALIFSQFTSFLDKVRERLDSTGTDYCYLDGKTRRRAKVIERFKEGDVPVFLISLKAGGFGLNLTEADYCFLLDPWWNPATETQAIDRTHRIGQTRNVMVYRLIAKDTIEEKVMALKTRKAELFNSVMDEGGAFDSTLDADDIRALLE